MAEAIVAAQSTEITQMRQRIDERYPDSSLTSNYANMMPAMDTLSGNEVDKAFLEGMIMHHLGAVQIASRSGIPRCLGPSLAIGVFMKNIPGRINNAIAPVNTR